MMNASPKCSKSRSWESCTAGFLVSLLCALAATWMARTTSSFPLSWSDAVPFGFWYTQGGLGLTSFVVHLGDLWEALRHQPKRSRKPSWRGAGGIHAFVTVILLVSGALVLFGLVLIFVLWLSATLKNNRAMLHDEVSWYALSLGHPIFQVYTIQSSSDRRTAPRAEHNSTCEHVRLQGPAEQVQDPSKEKAQEPEAEALESAC